MMEDKTTMITMTMVVVMIGFHSWEFGTYKLTTMLFHRDSIDYS